MAIDFPNTPTNNQEFTVGGITWIYYTATGNWQIKSVSQTVTANLSNATPLVESGAGSAGTSSDAARGDHVHPAAGVTATWGSITGTLSSQTDLNSALGDKAPIASPTFTGTPLSTTAAADTNTTQIATTEFVVGQAGTATPLVESGAGAVGTSLKYARQDHVHPAGGGGGTPGGDSGDIQYNNAGTFAGAANIHIENDVLRLEAVTPPAPPAAGGVSVFGRSIGGRILPAFMGPSGLDSSLQPNIARNNVAFFKPYQGATTVTAVGMTLGATGTATAKGTPASTNIYTSTAGLEYLVGTAATTAVAGVRIGTSAATNQYWRGNAAGLGGFFFIMRFGPATGTTIATNRMFCGYQQSTAAPTDVNPSTLTQMIGVGFAKGTDTNWQVMYNAASTATKVDTGIAVPTADRTKLYELAMFCAPNSSQISVEFTDLGTGSVFTHTATTNLPSNSAFGGFRAYHSVGGTSSIVGINVLGIYVETDY